MTDYVLTINEPELRLLGLGTETLREANPDDPDATTLDLKVSMLIGLADSIAEVARPIPDRMMWTYAMTVRWSYSAVHIDNANGWTVCGFAIPEGARFRQDQAEGIRISCRYCATESTHPLNRKEA